MKPATAVLLGLGAIALIALFVLLKPATSPTTTTATATASTMVAAPAMAPAAAAAQPHRYEMVIRNGRKLSGPEVIRVDQGEQLTLVITSDHADELHVHGYDLHAALTAGVPATLSFRADRSGRFSVELHHSDLPLGAVEVLPR